jgi:hypothetical protein
MNSNGIRQLNLVGNLSNERNIWRSKRLTKERVSGLLSVTVRYCHFVAICSKVLEDVGG